MGSLTARTLAEYYVEGLDIRSTPTVAGQDREDGADKIRHSRRREGKVRQLYGPTNRSLLDRGVTGYLLD